jgi:hypothetical protein
MGLSGLASRLSVFLTTWPMVNSATSMSGSL